MNSISFDDLTKLPQGPVARVLSQNNVKLQTTLTTPAGAPAAQVLESLYRQDAPLDMLQVLAHVLPARQATWWACLAAREMGATTAAVTAAEAWVRQPGFETRLAAREALETVKTDDDTGFCAMAGFAPWRPVLPMAPWDQVRWMITRPPRALWGPQFMGCC